MLTTSSTYILSIIIPVYQVERYIEECLKSVFSQLPVSVEIIIVDDGSPDRSVEIIKSKYSKWLANDHVLLLEKENAGPGSARNAGLAIARGKYIGFLDSDDILLEDYFNVILEIINTHSSDIVEFGFQRFHELSDIKRHEHQSLYAFKGLQELKNVRNRIFAVGVWFPSTRVFKKDLFDRVRFTEGVFYEDLMTIPHIYLKELIIYIIDFPLIGYRYNPNSTTALHSNSHAMDMYEFYLSLHRLKNTIPIQILKIKTARGIAYFFHELQSPDIPIAHVLNEICKIPKRFYLLKTLKLPDLLFFMFPRVYMFIDKIRLQSQIVKTDD